MKVSTRAESEPKQNQGTVDMTRWSWMLRGWGDRADENGSRGTSLEVIEFLAGNHGGLDKESGR